MNNVVCVATGDWKTTALLNNDLEVNAVEFYLEINAGDDDGWGNIDHGGIFSDAEIAGYVREEATPGDKYPIFPAHVEVQTPNGTLVVENLNHVGVNAPQATHVLYQGPVTENQLTDVTHGIINLLVNINFDTNTQQVRMALYKHHTFSFIWGGDEILNINML